MKIKSTLLSFGLLLCPLISAVSFADEQPTEFEHYVWAHLVVMDKEGAPMCPRLSAKGDKIDRLTPFPGHRGDPKKGELPWISDYQSIYVENIRQKIIASPKQEILFFIHGGMNVNLQAANNAVRLLRESHENHNGLTKKYYPIFICWDSPFTGYGEQALWVRAGKTERYGKGQLYAWLSLPFQVLADCGRAVTKLPLTLSEFAYNDLYSIRPDGFTEHQFMSNEYCVYQGQTRMALR